MLIIWGCNLQYLNIHLMGVRPKKFLGQHFLTNHDTAQKIVNALEVDEGSDVLEIGPGTGVLTKFLLNRKLNLYLVELDRDSVVFLKENFGLSDQLVIEADFLKLDLGKIFHSNFYIIGNFPYNISSQIFFRVLEYRSQVKGLVGMIQKEVAQRIAAPPGSKTYGILSVLLQAYYNIEYLFTVKPGQFNPPPKVDSAVIQMKRNKTDHLDCDEKLFFRIVKQGFQNRRKTLRNALKPINLPDSVRINPMLDKRAEALSVDDFVFLTKKIEKEWNK